MFKQWIIHTRPPWACSFEILFDESGLNPLIGISDKSIKQTKTPTISHRKIGNRKIQDFKPYLQSLMKKDSNPNSFFTTKSNFVNSHLLPQLGRHLNLNYFLSECIPNHCSSNVEWMGDINGKW